MKKKYLFFVIFCFFSITKLMAQCDCMVNLGDMIFPSEECKIKRYKARFEGNNNRIIEFGLLLKKNKRYVFETYDKYGKKTERVKVTITTVDKKPLIENIKRDKIQDKFEFCTSENNLFFMEIRLIEPETPHCTCAYVIMFIYDK